MASDQLSLPFCLSSLKTQAENRRSANYQPNQWTHEFLQSLGNHLQVETLQERATKLEENVRLMINETDMDPLSLFELVDDMERLGLSYKFHEDINRALHKIVSIEYIKEQTTNKSLHETALFFRILRQHGFDVSEDVFKSFKDDEGKFKSEISNNVEGMLSLYEASYLTLEGETLWEANAFSRTFLENLMKEGMIEGKVAEQVRNVLEGLPFHKKFHRAEARQYIDTYDKTESHNQLLLELAKLDFNMVQSSHQKELQELSRWWRDIGLASRMNFARDRLVETFVFSLGSFPDPQFTDCRIELTKVGQLITVVDDVYDTYGTLDELELFTVAVERWDIINAINTLPNYLMLCFSALYNSVNVMAYDIFKERGVKCLPYLTKAWSDLCKSYLQKAKWFYNKDIPPFNEVLEDGVISSSGVVGHTHAYFLLAQDQDITEQALQSLVNHHDLVRSACLILRLANDLGTSTYEAERGETSVSILSCLHQTGLSQEHARQYCKTLIDKEWHNLNKYLAMDSIFPKSFTQFAINLARASEYVYQYGDGYGRQDNISKSRIKSLLVDPIQLA